MVSTCCRKLPEISIKKREDIEPPLKEYFQVMVEGQLLGRE